jgi:hypothetical protein
LFCGHVPIVHVRDTLTSIQRAEGVQEEDLVIPSDLTFQIQRGDLRAFVTAVQFGNDLNKWDKWFERLTSGGPSLCVWEDGLKLIPFCILIRHVFLWMNSKGYLDDTYEHRPRIEEFITLCFNAQNSQVDSILEVVSEAWDKLKLQ